MAIAKRVAILILCFALACHVDATPRPRTVAGPDIFKNKNVAKDVLLPGEKLLSVMSFGAKPDGVFDSTQAFMNTWRKVCHESTEPTRFYVPPGRFLISPIIFQGPCTVPSPITFQVEGTVLATEDISEFENSEWLMFQKLNGLKIIGGGIFDGQGKSSWQYAENCESSADDQCVRNPSSLYFEEVSNVVVQNIRSVNPKGFHIFVTKSSNVRLRKLKLVAPETSPNTDGIHISLSDTVIISRNTIATGDDCISMIQGVKNIFINRLKCGPGHGISIGSLGKYEDEQEVRGVRIKNCSLIGTTNGLRVKAWPEKYPGAASDISFSDIIMQNVKNPIIIDEEYECYPNCKKKPSLVKINNVHFSNIKGTTISPIAVDLRCSQLFPCQGVTVQDIDLKLGLAPTSARCVNTKPIFGGLQNPPPCP
ncbi:exopolygalacturonase-like [Abrus precatorius]|uniref:Exopolygalacturonase-like n=1 Tax=Abrus precatorius TaxID=3816 RepID=A0A8B8MJD2_ABRPR|nr:exopolygalacturonase-like [Abrus precatorius]